MTDPTQLTDKEQEAAKKKAYADGTADISLGLVFLLLGFYNWSRELLGTTLNMVLFLVFIVAIILTLQVLRNRLVPEQVGAVDYSPPEKQSKRVFALIAILIIFGMIAAWILSIRGWSSDLPPFLQDYGFGLVVALVMMGMFSAAAFFLDMPRYYLYGLLLASGMPLQASLDGILGAINRSAERDEVAAA
jgi:hypothetical protein